MKIEKTDTGLWGMISAVFFVLVIGLWIFKGGRYVLDSEYRSEIHAKNAQKEIELLNRKAQENRAKWIINRCDIPGNCDEVGNRY